MTDDMRLRAATTSEIERVRQIERASASRFVGTARAALADDEPTDGATLTQRIAAGGLLVAEQDGEVVAFVMFRAVEGCGYIEQIDVLPSHERRGIGARLIEAVAEVARGRGWPALTLSTFKDVPFNAPYYRRKSGPSMRRAVWTRALGCSCGGRSSAFLSSGSSWPAT